MALAQLTPEQKKLFIQDVGASLVRDHGKKQSYTRREVDAAARRVGAPQSWDCWAYSFFMSAPDFVEYHVSIGEVCDYAVMRTAMVESLTEVGAGFDFDLSWLEWPVEILAGVFDFW